MKDAKGTLRRLRYLLPFVGLAVGLLLLHRLVDLPSALARILEADPAWIGVALGLMLLAPVLVAVKLWSFVHVAGETVTIGRCWSAVMAAVALNAALPGRGGDIVRAVFLADTPGTVSLLLGVVLLERLVDVFTLGLLSLIAAVFGGVSVATPLALGVCVAAMGAIGAMALGHRSPWKPALAERVGRAARRMPGAPGLTALGVVASLLSWAVSVALMGACLKAVGAVFLAMDVARATPVAILAGIVPITVGGIGTRDTALVLLLGDPAQGDRVAAGAFLYTAISLWLQGLLGLGALGRETLRRTRRAAERERADAS